LNKSEELLKIIGSTGTKQILEYIDEHGTARYRDLHPSLNSHTLNSRLRDFLLLGLVEHHIEKKEKRIEWYNITEKGKKVAQLMRDVITLMD
jgi:DNA-binding HxlR family transcriptional regulator